MIHSATRHAWSAVGLAVLPGGIYLLAWMIIAANEDWWPAFWLRDAAALVTAILVIGLSLRREKRLPLYSLFAAGLSAFLLIKLGSRALGMLMGDRVIPASAEAARYTMWHNVWGMVALSLSLLVLIGGALAARRYGAAAALMVAGLLGPFAYDFFDPTNGLLVIAADQYSLLGVTALNVVGQLPILILLPSAVLLARSERRQMSALLGVFGAALIGMLLLSLLHDFALEGVSGAPPLAERLWHTFTVRPLFLVPLWLLLAAITLGYGALKRRELPPAAETATQLA